MNYYNPYFYTFPYDIGMNAGRVGLLSRLFGSNFSFGKLIDGTQKVLNFANQAIPLVKQVKPVIGNAKTMFRVMNEFKKVEKSNNNTINQNTSNNNVNLNNNGPTFFA